MREILSIYHTIWFFHLLMSRQEPSLPNQQEPRLQERSYVHKVAGFINMKSPADEVKLPERVSRFIKETF